MLFNDNQSDKFDKTFHILQKKKRVNASHFLHQTEQTEIFCLLINRHKAETFDLIRIKATHTIVVQFVE